jgi:hypothetical protein
MFSQVQASLPAMALDFRWSATHCCLLAASQHSLVVVSTIPKRRSSVTTFGRGASSGGSNA